MVDLVSPLGPAFKPGRHGSATGEAGVVLSETQPGSIVQIAGWPATEPALLKIIEAISGLKLGDTPGAGASTASRAAFGFAPRKFLVVDEIEDLFAKYEAAITHDVGVVTDLSHGRTALRVSGPKAEWVLSKLFAVDVSTTAFPVGAGRSTMHHDIFAQIQRTGDTAFDLYVFRSFARSFWTTLCHASEDVGYEVR